MTRKSRHRRKQTKAEGLARLDLRLAPASEDAEREVTVEQMLEVVGTSSYEMFRKELQKFLGHLEPGDTLIEFCSNRASWDELMGFAGYQIKRDGEIVKMLVTSMN